jgi:mono/diheme cytochrome c family protein
MSSRRKAHFVLFGSLLLASAACSKAPAQTSPSSTEQAPVAASPAAEVTQSPKVEANTMFHSRCIVCHGEQGKGDGPGSAALNPKPRNYTDGVWQKSVTDEQITNVIMYGGAAAGKSPIMPASPDLQSKPEVVAELVKIVRSFRPN